ncbi:hypothetical protein IFM89_035959 [Coptis chinensis]|uniref:Uncharacterized protein n=1 Tax=Coptis chinensis TaxID=261450 RepID=A0A835GZV6_9MAGN|nr:hypothetical protein IFM89_035959 [Coptis chinensis]
MTCLRMLRSYKKYVKNPAHPEGCIAKRYVIEESIMYCMEHMPNGSKGSHKRGKERYIDDDGEFDMADQENAKSSRKKLKKAKKEKVVMHDVMPTNTSRVEAKKGKAVMHDDKPTNTSRVKSPSKKRKMAKKEKALLHVVMPRDINEEMTESPAQMRKKAKKDKASKQNVLAGDMNQRIYNSTSRGESSKQGTKRIEKEKASIYAALTRNENGGVRFIDSTTKGSNQGSSARMCHQGSMPSFISRFFEQLGGNKKIEFDADGQAVGDDSYSYSSALGGTAKTHCPIFYESFKDVPSPTKRLIWKKIKDEYGIAEVYKKCQLKKFAKSWREYKHRLQVKHYDKYDNDDERKRHCPKGVKREDWDRFVDNEAKPSRKRMRLVGKNSRKALKLLHTSGRRGAARTIHNLARINAIIEDDPSSIDLDLDNDLVAQVCGPDQYGRVLGMGVVMREPANTQLVETIHMDFNVVLVHENILLSDQVGNFYILPLLELIMRKYRFRVLKMIVDYLYEGINTEFSALRVDTLWWLGSLASLRYLGMNQVDMSMLSVNSLRVLNRLSFLTELHFSGCSLSGFAPSFDLVI